MTQRGSKKLGSGLRHWWDRSAVRFGSAAVLMVLLTGCVGTVSPGYVGEPYYDPYYYSYEPYPYYGDVYIGAYPYHRHYAREYYHRGFDAHRQFYGRTARVPAPVPNVGGYRGTYTGHGHGSSRGHRE